MKVFISSLLAVIMAVFGIECTAKRPKAFDPGVRRGIAGAGQPVAGLSADQLRFFNDGLNRFVHAEGVANGLGPGFNADSCGACHSQPAIGGTSPAVNPQVSVAHLMGATNQIPFFVAINGPVREARFKSDGGVHDLFSIQGRSDAPGCTYPQPDFITAARNNNLIFRIPTPVFGGGFIEAISDETIVANMNSNLAAKKAMGISGVPNRSGNTGNITRFGWKAQNPSLEVFSDEAYNVEIGETNAAFPNKRGNPPASCVFNSLPEDSTNFNSNPSDPINVPSDDVQFSNFMRFLDQPTEAQLTSAGTHGQWVFNVVGCVLCHTPALRTGNSTFATSLSNVPANLYSDLLLHHMGKGLADGITQGNAGPDQFRTAPLWGLGQRIFFLHDGRTSDLVVAIEQHKSRGSEANKVIKNYNHLSPSDQQDLLVFLRSL